MSNQKQITKLNYSELTKLINESLQKILKENDMEEGWFNDKWKQAKSSVGTAMNAQGNIKQKFNNARQNWNTQGELNNISNLRQQIMQLIDSKRINPQITLAQFVGGAYNNGRFGTMDGMAMNRKRQIQKRGGQAYEEE